MSWPVWGRTRSVRMCSDGRSPAAARDSIRRKQAFDGRRRTYWRSADAIGGQGWGLIELDLDSVPDERLESGRPIGSEPAAVDVLPAAAFDGSPVHAVDGQGAGGRRPGRVMDRVRLWRGPRDRGAELHHPAVGWPRAPEHDPGGEGSVQLRPLRERRQNRRHCQDRAGHGTPFLRDRALGQSSALAAPRRRADRPSRAMR